MNTQSNKTRKCIRKGGDARVLFALHILYKKLRHLQQEHETRDESTSVWWDAAYVQEFVGISERTLYRYQQKAMLGTVRKENGKRLFLQTAVERFKRTYWKR